ncbi:MAG: hypothetical protein ACFCGT_26355 [Sandaracinaceae bacterium]
MSWKTTMSWLLGVSLAAVVVMAVGCDSEPVVDAGLVVEGDAWIVQLSGELASGGVGGGTGVAVEFPSGALAVVGHLGFDDDEHTGHFNARFNDQGEFLGQVASAVAGEGGYLCGWSPVVTDAIATADGDVVVVRRDGSCGCRDCGAVGSDNIVTRHAPDGTERWRRRYQNAPLGHGQVIELADGSLVLMGGVASFARIDAHGETIWTRESSAATLGAWPRRSGGLMVDGDEIGAASTGLMESGQVETWVVRLDMEGEGVSQTVYTVPAGIPVTNTSALGATPVLSEDGSIAVAGYAAFRSPASPDRETALWILHIDSSGNHAWRTLLTGSQFNFYARPALAMVEGGGLVVVGEADGYGVIVRLRADGSVEWQQALSEWVPTGVISTSGGATVAIGRLAGDLALVYLAGPGDFSSCAAFFDPQLVVDSSSISPVSVESVEGGAMPFELDSEALEVTPSDVSASVSYDYVCRP